MTIGELQDTQDALKDLDRYIDGTEANLAGMRESRRKLEEVLIQKIIEERDDD